MESTKEQELEQKVKALEARLAGNAREHDKTPPQQYGMQKPQLYQNSGTERPDASMQRLREGNGNYDGLQGIIAMYTAMGHAYQQMAAAFKHGTEYVRAMQAYASPRGAKPAYATK